jgi:hypothetical protein
VIFLVGTSIAYFSCALTASMGATSLQLLTPPPLRGRLSGLYASITNLIGTDLGPLVVAVLTQDILRDRAKIGVSLMIVLPVSSLAGACILAMGWRRYGRVIEEFSSRPAG